MSKFPIVEKELMDEFVLWMKPNYARKTIKEYRNFLKLIPEDVFDYLTDEKVRARKNKIAAYRLFCTFLMREKRLLSRSEYEELKFLISYPKRRGNNHSERRKIILFNEWEEIIRKAPNRVAKMGILIGFEWCLRIGEIIHLRIDDIDFDIGQLLIREHKEEENQDYWHPKHYRERQLKMSKRQQEFMKKWFELRRLEGLNHNYVLWTQSGSRKGKRVLERTFRYWCNEAGISPHVIRRSAATNYYYKSNKDLILIRDILGHANISTTSEYLQLDKKETLKKMEKIFA